MAFGFIPRSFDGLKDDGCLQCDRQLLLALGIAKEDKMLFCTKAVTVEEGDQIVVKTEATTKKRKIGHDRSRVRAVRNMDECHML